MEGGDELKGTSFATQYTRDCYGRMTQLDAYQAYFSFLDDEELTDCFLNLPSARELPNPTRYGWIQQHLFEDEELNNAHEQNPEKFPIKQFGDYPLICYARPGEAETNWRIALPSSLVPDMVHWYHVVMGHPGITRLRDSIQERFFHPFLRTAVEEYNCEICAQNKIAGAGYGELAAPDVTAGPWQEIACDLIEPWTIIVEDQAYEFNALTVIDLITKKIMELEDKKQSWII